MYWLFMGVAVMIFLPVIIWLIDLVIDWFEKK